MKYLGQTDNDCIISISKKELSHLLGNNFTQDVKWDSFRLGQTLDICKTWESLNELSKTKKDLKYMAKRLREMANTLDLHHPEIRIEEQK